MPIDPGDVPPRIGMPGATGATGAAGAAAGPVGGGRGRPLTFGGGAGPIRSA